MSINEFFNKISLNITFQDEYLHENFVNMFEHFKQEYQTNTSDVIDELKNSYVYETGEEIHKNMYERLLNEDNDIIKLYNIIEPKLPCVRNRKVYVNDSFGTAYTGAKQSYIDIDRLQAWVDEFHSFEFDNNTDKMLCGFILYLLYVRIHPHIDGNGRISRYLFLENKLLKGLNNFCPLSSILNNQLRLPAEHMENIFNWLDETVDAEHSTKEDYYKLYIPNDMLKQMYYIIYIAVCYKYCTKTSDEFIQLMNSIDDFKYIFCLGKCCMQVGQSTTLNSIGRRNRNMKYVKVINDLIDFRTHVDIIKLFHHP